MTKRSEKLTEKEVAKEMGKVTSSDALKEVILTKEEKIAIMCHQANKVWCELNGDNSQKDWDKAEQWQKDSAINGVRFKIENPEASAAKMHNNWMKEKVDNGWVYGKKKDVNKKTHPSLLPFNELPESEQKKDAVFSAIVNALK